MAILRMAFNLLLKIFGITVLVYAVLYLTPGSLRMRVTDVEGDVQIVRKKGVSEPASKGRQLYSGDGILTGDGTAWLIYETVGQIDTVKVGRRENFQVGSPGELVGTYLDWLTGVARGKMGYYKGEPVVERLLRSTPRTLLLVGGALGISLGVALGMVFLSLRAGNNALVNNLISLLNLLSGVHIIVLSFAVIIARLAMPITGFSIWLPLILAVGNGTLVDYYAVLREQISGTLNQDYVDAATGRGASPLRHATIYEITLGIIDATHSRVPALIGGTIIVEWIFSYLGLGYDIIRAIQDRSFELIMGVTALLATLLIALTETTDFLRRKLDPRLAR